VTVSFGDQVGLLPGSNRSSNYGFSRSRCAPQVNRREGDSWTARESSAVPAMVGVEHVDPLVVENTAKDVLCNYVVAAVARAQRRSE